MIKTGRRYGASCFSISALTYWALVPEDQIVDIGLSLHGLHSSLFPYPPFYVPPPEKCLSFIFSQGSFFSVSKSLVRLPRFRAFFPVRMPSCFCPFFVQFRLIAAKIGKTKFSIGEGVAFFHFHDTITVQILMEVLPMAYQIGSGCVSCGACADVCPVGAISQGDDHYVIDANSCLDCGTCSDTCPNGAISPAE